MGKTLDKIKKNLDEILVITTATTGIASFSFPNHPEIDYAFWGLMGVSIGYIAGSWIYRYLQKKRSYY